MGICSSSCQNNQQTKTRQRKTSSSSYETNNIDRSGHRFSKQKNLTFRKNSEKSLSDEFWASAQNHQNSVDNHKPKSKRDKAKYSKQEFEDFRQIFNSFLQKVEKKEKNFNKTLSPKLEERLATIREIVSSKSIQLEFQKLKSPSLIKLQKVLEKSESDNKISNISNFLNDLDLSLSEYQNSEEEDLDQFSINKVPKLVPKLGETESKFAR